MRYLLFILIPVLFLLNSCSDLQDPVFNSIGNVRLKSPGIKTSLMTFDMEYFNPNNKKAKLKEAEGEAWVDSNFLGHFYVDTLVNIPARGNFTLPVKMNVEMKELVKYSLSNDLSQPVLIRIKGNARIGKGGFYKRFSLDYQGKQNLGELFKQK